MLYIRPQAFKCQPALQRCSYNLCWCTAALPFFEAELWGRAEPLVPFLSLLCSPEQPSAQEQEPREDFTLLTTAQPGDSQVTTARGKPEDQKVRQQRVKDANQRAWPPGNPLLSQFFSQVVLKLLQWLMGYNLRRNLKARSFFMLQILIGYGPYTFKQLIIFTSN